MRLPEALHIRSESPSGGAPARNRRLLAFRILAVLPILLFAVNATNLLAPWTFVLDPSDDLPEPHRWFFVVSAAADLLLLASFAGLIVRPRWTVLAAWIPISFAIVLVTIVPLQPWFLLFVLVIAGPATLAYPYWGDLRGWRRWWDGVRPELLAFAAVVAAAMLVIAVIAFRRQIVRDDAVSDANWWNDDAEHTADIALAGLLAISRGPGALLLRAVLGGIWVYLGIIAAFVLPDAIGSVGRVGGLVGIAIGLVFAWSAWTELRTPRVIDLRDPIPST
jgi:hypothetical protein